MKFVNTKEIWDLIPNISKFCWGLVGVPSSETLLVIEMYQEARSMHSRFWHFHLYLGSLIYP